VWLDSPGFWDGGTIYQYNFDPLFTVAILRRGRLRHPDARADAPVGRPPSSLSSIVSPVGLTATEVRTVHPGGVFASEWRLRAMRQTTVHLVAWTSQDGATIDPASVVWNGALSFTGARCSIAPTFR
jgi:hypothetical protein